ncbi:hypothetical protein [Massilia sp. WG5]|nr:hypothetical protein [Massilia sp. WG5]
MTIVGSTTALQITVLLGGVATFCGVVLSRANPLCTWLEWAGVCCDDGEDTQRHS